MIGETPTGKGSAQRTVTSETFRAHFDAINWGKPVFCDSCKKEIDPECCCCGQSMSGHSIWETHTPTPMGCVCGYASRRTPCIDQIEESLGKRSG